LFIRLHARFVLFLLTIAIFASAPAAFAQDRPTHSLQTQIYNEEHQLASAERSQNPSFFQQKLDPALIYVAYNGLVFTKDKLVSDLGYIDVSHYGIENMKVRSLGHGAALATYDLILNGNIAGQKLPSKQYASSVWVESGGQWKLIFHQCTPAHH
jgi:hypothetical protein